MYQKKMSLQNQRRFFSQSENIIQDKKKIRSYSSVTTCSEISPLTVDIMGYISIQIHVQGVILQSILDSPHVHVISY